MSLGLGALGEFALGQGPTQSAGAASAPFSQTNWPSAKRPRSSTPQSIGLNLALIASLGPFNQKDWTPVKKAPRPAISLSRAQTLPLIASLGPFRQQDFTKPALPKRSPPQLASLNINLIASLGPFRQSFLPNPKQPVTSVALPPANVALLVQQSTPFANFTFPVAVKARLTPPVYPVYNLPIYAPVPDTHDGVWVKKKRKKLDRDPLDLELEERSKRRAAIELAVYGPEVTYEPPAPTLFAPPAPPPNVEELAKAIMAAKQMLEQQQRAALEQDDEDVLEIILRDL
jgi:hypothetical protein